MRVPAEGKLTRRQIVQWFDHKMPEDLPDEVVDKLVEDFFEQHTKVVGYTDQEIIHSRSGWRARLDTLNKEVWLADVRTVARKLALQGLPMSQVQKQALKPWMVRPYEEVLAHRWAKEVVAARKAEDLLRSLVSQEQWYSWQMHGFIAEPSTLHPGTQYLLKGGERAGNISVIDVPVGMQGVMEVETRAVICTAPVEDYPEADIVVAQLLHLRGDEAHFLQVANLHSGRFSEAELAVRERRTFVMVPRYDRLMGGFVDTPVDLAALGGPATPSPMPRTYDEQREMERAERRSLEDEDFEAGVWAAAAPDHVIERYRTRIMAKIAQLNPDPKAVGAMLEVEVPDELVELDRDSGQWTLDLSEQRVRLDWARTIKGVAIKAYWAAMGDDPEDPVIGQLSITVGALKEADEKAAAREDEEAEAEAGQAQEVSA